MGPQSSAQGFRININPYKSQGKETWKGFLYSFLDFLLYGFSDAA
jgi:hypothetical protein